ncbi:MAG: hypothetical protein K6B74_05040 [Ruminococcus sp.]|nr:hypothetical protein [Ruminococcus sp.]
MQEKEASTALLRETNAGIQMGVSSISDIIGDVESAEFRQALHDAKLVHDELGGEAHKLLHLYGSDTKEPHPVAKAMSTAKTAVKMTVDRSDRTAAELITDGCAMGIKSLTHYLNVYKNADSKVRSLTKRVISSEEQLIDSVKGYL